MMYVNKSAFPEYFYYSFGKFSSVNGVLSNVNLAVIEILEIFIGGLFDIVKHVEFLSEISLGKSQSAQKEVFVIQNIFQVSCGVSAVSRGEHNKSGIVSCSIVESDTDRGGNTFGILGIILLSSVSECAFFHQASGLFIEESFVTIVLRLQHK